MTDELDERAIFQEGADAMRDECTKVLEMHKAEIKRALIGRDRLPMTIFSAMVNYLDDTIDMISRISVTRQ